MIYADAAATTPVDPRVEAAMEEAQRWWGNENSSHLLGQRSAKAMQACLQSIAKIWGVDPAQLAVTYSGTDANRRVLWAAARRWGWDSIVVSAVEHSSIRDEVSDAQRFDPRDPDSIPLKNPKLIALTQANSETGATYNPQIFRGKFPTSLILQDAAQSWSKGLRPDFETADFITFTPQKFYGPKMIGLLYIKEPLAWPELSADRHTKSVPLIAGAAKAVELWSQEQDAATKKLAGWTEQLENFIQKNIPDSLIHDQSHPRVPGITNVAFAGVRGGELMRVLSDQEQICVSIGSACTSDIMQPTEVIRFIQPDPQWQYPLRISFHQHLRDEDITELGEVLAHYVQQLRSGQRS